MMILLFSYIHCYFQQGRVDLSTLFLFSDFLPKLFSVFCCTLINFVYLYSVENDV